MNDLTQRIFKIIQKPHLAVLATINEEGKPWVRYVTPSATEDLTLRFATFTKSRKVAQINKNNEVHLTCGVTDPSQAEDYLQIQGRAEFSTNQHDKDICWFDNLSSIFNGPDDPNYAVIIVKPYRIELWNMKSFEPEVWEA